MYKRQLYVLLACVIALGALGWWQWQRSWSELETHAQAAGPGARRYGETQVSFDTMQNRIVTKVEPVYPEAALAAGTEGLVVLDADVYKRQVVELAVRKFRGNDVHRVEYIVCGRSEIP